MSNAILLFLAAGIIPGTGIRLSPDAAVGVIGGLAPLVIAGIFRKEIIRAGRSIMGGRRDKPAANVAPYVVVPVPAPKPIIRIAPVPAPKPAVIITIPGRPGYIARAITASRPYIREAMAQLPALFRSIRLELVQMARAAIKQLIIYWQWLEPHIRRFDRWLEVTLKRNKNIAVLIALMSEFSRQASERTALVRAFFARTAEKE
ncbi:MAG TPA: hypothetical protein VJ836_03660 [Candidatus Saccharimonadales bacterium]|nr:hypothetical protein [Candidatus Saccharimonadales bacterium]